MSFVANFVLFIAVKNMKIGYVLAKLQHYFLGHSVVAAFYYLM